MEKVLKTLDKYNSIILNQSNDSLDERRQKIYSILKQLDKDIQQIEDENYDIYCFYKYFIANQSIKYLNLNKNEKETFLEHLSTYKEQVIVKIKNTEMELNQLTFQQPSNNQLIQQYLNKLKDEVELIKEEDKSFYDHYQKLIFERFVDKQEKIKKILNTLSQLVKNHSFEEEEEECFQKQIQQALKQLEESTRTLEEDDYDQYGYYCFLIAYYRKEYLNLNPKDAENCENVKNSYRDHILNKIEEIYNEVLNITSKMKSIDQTNFQEYLNNLQNEIQFIEKEDYQKFGYYKYIIAENKLNYLNLDLKQQKKCEQEKKNFMKYYEQYLSLQYNENLENHHLKAVNIVPNIINQKQILNNQLNQQETAFKQSTSIIKSLEENLSQLQKQEKGNENINISNISSQNFQYANIQNQNQIQSNQPTSKQTTIQQLISSCKTSDISSLSENESNKQQLQLSNQISNKSIHEIARENINKISSQSQKDESVTQKVYLIMGETGVGKSSFVQYLTGDPRAEIGHQGNSHTQNCRAFIKDELNFIDSPGINDTNENKYNILLNIVKYLKQEKYRFQDLFIICVSNKDLNNHLKYLQEISYTYFLYELFGDQIKFRDVEKLVNEYYQSTCLLNWQEAGFHSLQDCYTEKRVEIFKNKDQALNYIQYAQNLHIIVKTCFDKTHKENLKIFNDYQVDFLKQQIWSNKRENCNDLLAYREYIQNQEYHLFNKIKKIIQQWEEVHTWNQGEQIQYLLLIGGSQVGKSSLIEQLKQISGLRGSGEQSKTSLCQIFLVEYNKVKYFFIDTPGFEGTESNQSQYHSLKVISDFLRRNRISEFKVLYMRDADKEVRNGMPAVLNKLFIFIQEMFDQDSSFIDSAYLRELITIQASQTNNQQGFINHQLNSIANKILTIERVQERKHEGLIYMNIFNNKSIEFQSNFYSFDRKLIQINQTDDILQKNTLFEGVNQIEPICVDEKIYTKIKKIINCKLINNLSDFMIAFSKLLQLYQQYNNILDQINSRKQVNQIISEDLNNQRIKIIKDLNNITYIVIGDFQNTQEMKNYIQRQFLYQMQSNNQQNHQNEIKNRILNSIQKHFLKASYTQYLFEAQQNPNNIFLSRKLLYFWSFTHQLSPFLRDDQKHKKILEQLAKIKILQELTVHSHIQSKIIENQYDYTPEQINHQIQVFFSGMNTALGTGAQIFRFATYFSNISEATLQAQKLAKTVNFVSMWEGFILSALSFGIDLWFYSKGYICGNQMFLNTSYNAASFSLSVVALTVPGIGWLAGGIAGAIGLIGYGISAYKYTSFQTFDETLGLVLKTIIDDNHPNQILLYFQKSQFLKQHKITNYSQTQSKDAYEMFRQLEKKNYESGEQNKFLLKLFNQSEYPCRLQDEISKYIVKNIISKHFYSEIEQFQDQDPIKYLKVIQKLLERNEKTINTFYKSFYTKNLLNNIQQNQNELKEILNKKNDQFKKEKNVQRNCLNDDQNFSQALETYQLSLKKFIKHIENTDYNYEEQKEFGNGALRKCDRYPITFQGYCNLVHQKSQYIFKQDTISEISKKNNCFEVKPENNFNSQFFQFQDDNELINSINILITSDKFVTSRYLLKLKGQDKPSLSFMNDTEVIDAEVEYSIDLYQVADKSNNFKDFVEKIKNKTKNEFDINDEIDMRLRNFFQSIVDLKKIFG
ncbi:50S ribosome-binding GTPase (macronuclear) [Tetrahymena thermophila SB210]|uniref:50S ribosome-binding GTPase n=1 Tax=Tetrahymena thermophila (strain SB210) TaxID=312017 RepID=Q22WI1_TETTS|nr:50S ribosome-binding GTPase [Tetrahymena thermophila SB210]EAR89436.2 50S ribosome-binding GTPase [Tetrahymena thermophila SB210]|eukprot:XP_001009681.2 50S ribosome-binding GTPase [Tetrahymena thermophila SB210]